MSGQQEQGWNAAALGRRGFLVGLAGVALGVPALVTSRKSLAATRAEEALSFVHTHTGEALLVAYRLQGERVSAALESISRFLRDHRNGEIHAIDPALLDQLANLARITGTRAPFEVISGYRSPRTNEMLRRTGGGGVAKASLHLEGRAIDIRLGDVSLADLRDAARSMKAGGVGYYAASDFVHLDTGRVRHW